MIVINDKSKDNIVYDVEDSTKIKAILDIFIAGLTPILENKNIYEILRACKRRGDLNEYNKQDVVDFIEKILFGG